MKKLFIYSLTVVLILAIALSGCGGGKSGGPGGNPGGNPGGTTYTPGQSAPYTVGSGASAVSFNMHYVPGNLTFPTDYDTATMINSDNDETIDPPDTTPGAAGSADIKITVRNAYWIAETEVTYELWDKVKTWAIDNKGYAFVDSDDYGTHGIKGTAIQAMINNR